MKTEKIKSLAKRNDDKAIVAGVGSAGPGWYAIMLWPSMRIIEDNVTDIGLHAESKANTLAAECGLMTEAQYEVAQIAEQIAEEAARKARLNSTAGKQKRLAQTNEIRARVGFAPLDSVPNV